MGICISFLGYIVHVVDPCLDFVRIVGLWGWNYVGIVGYALYVRLEAPIGVGGSVMILIVCLMRRQIFRSLFIVFVIYVV